MANRGGVEMETMRHFIFLGSKITVDDDWSHEIKWRLFLGRKAITNVLWFSSVAQSSNSLQPHESQHTRPPCSSATPGVHPNPCPLSQWCHSTISSSVVPFSFCPQSFPASGSFPRSQLFASGGQSIGVLASTSVLPMNIQDWFHLVWTGWNLLAVQGTLKSLLQHHSSESLVLQHSAFFIVTSIYDSWKNHSFD